MVRLFLPSLFIFFFAFIPCFGMEGLGHFFNFRVDFANKSLNLNLDLKENGLADIKGHIKGNEFNLNAFLNHLKFARFDLLTDIQAKGTIDCSSGKIEFLKGTAWTQRTLLNLKPVKELRINYEFSNGRIKINSLNWSKINLSGIVGLRPQVQFDLILLIEDMDVCEIIDLSGIDSGNYGLNGKAAAKFIIKGPAEALRIEGKIDIGECRMFGSEFKSARLNLQGVWPYLRFVDSKIQELTGTVYEVGGQINLLRLADLSSHNVTISFADNTMRFQDWAIKRTSSKISGKDIVEAEYLLKKGQALKMRIKKEEEILAWEKTVSF